MRDLILMSWKHEKNTHFLFLFDFPSFLPSLQSSSFSQDPSPLESYLSGSLPRESSSSLESYMLSTSHSLETQTWAIKLLERVAHPCLPLQWRPCWLTQHHPAPSSGFSAFPGLPGARALHQDIDHSCKPSPRERIHLQLVTSPFPPDPSSSSLQRDNPQIPTVIDVLCIKGLQWTDREPGSKLPKRTFCKDEIFCVGNIGLFFFPSL